MLSYLTIDKGKAETVLFKMGLCLSICRYSKILKSTREVTFVTKQGRYALFFA